MENGDKYLGEASSVDMCMKKSNPYVELDHANEQPTTAAAAAMTRASTRDAYVQAAAVAARRKESYVHTMASAAMHSIHSHVIPPLLPTVVGKLPSSGLHAPFFLCGDAWVASLCDWL